MLRSRWGHLQNSSTQLQLQNLHNYSEGGGLAGPTRCYRNATLCGDRASDAQNCGFHAYANRDRARGALCRDHVSRMRERVQLSSKTMVEVANVHNSRRKRRWRLPRCQSVTMCHVRVCESVPLGEGKHAGKNAARRCGAGCLAASSRLGVALLYLASLWHILWPNYVCDVAVPCGFCGASVESAFP